MAIGICTPMVTVEDIVNGVKDEYGCRYTRDGKYLLKGCEGITSYTIKAGTEIIWDNAFYYFSLLEAVVIPDSVTMICREAFWGCRSLRDVVIPESVTLIGDNAFRDCTSLQSIVIPESVTEIGSGAFAGCNSIQSIFVARGKAEYYKILLGADLHCRVKEAE